MVPTNMTSILVIAAALAACDAGSIEIALCSRGAWWLLDCSQPATRL